MTKFSVGLLVFAFMAGFASFNTSARAQEDSTSNADAPAAAAGEATEQESFVEMLEGDLKETTTPTDEETDPIGTAENAGRDLY